MDRNQGNKPSDKAVRKIRSTFGTRVARKVVCEACGAEDTIHFAPRAGQTVLCRACAAERFGAVDPDSSIGIEQLSLCDRCRLHVPKVCTYEDPLDCREHARALALRQSDRTKAGTRTQGVIRVRKARSDQEQ